jgi:hypothetical protein
VVKDVLKDELEYESQCIEIVIEILSSSKG